MCACERVCVPALTLACCSRKSIEQAVWWSRPLSARWRSLSVEARWRVARCCLGWRLGQRSSRSLSALARGVCPSKLGKLGKPAEQAGRVACCSQVSPRTWRAARAGGASAGDVCVSSQSVAGVPPRPAPAAASSLVRPIRPSSQSPACPAEVWRRASHGVPAASLCSLLAYPVPARAALGRERRAGRPSQPPGAACAPPHAHSRASARFKKSAQRRRRLCGSPVVV